MTHCKGDGGIGGWLRWKRECNDGRLIPCVEVLPAWCEGGWGGLFLRNESEAGGLETLGEVMDGLEGGRRCGDEFAEPACQLVPRDA